MRVAVIGAGVAGAAAAYTLARSGVSAVVLEAADGVGGRARTMCQGQFNVDYGAVFIMGSFAKTLRYLRQSGHYSETSRWIARTLIVDELGTRQRVRFDQPWSLLRMPQLTMKDRARMLMGLAKVMRLDGPDLFDSADLVSADNGLSLADWAVSMFGGRVYEYVIRPMTGVLTGADPSAISAAFTIGLLRSAARSRLIVPPEGIGQVATWLLEGIDVRLSTPALSLNAAGEKLLVATPNETIEADGVIVATDVRRASVLLDGVVDIDVIRALDSVRTVPGYHVNFCYQEDPWPDVSYDLVVEAGPGLHTNYGVLLHSRRTPGAVPSGAQVVSVYLDTLNGSLDVDVDDPLGRAYDAVVRAFGSHSPDSVQLYEIRDALIAPVPGHYAAMSEMRRSMPKSIRLAGDYLTHSGIESAFGSGELAAHELLAAK